LNILHIANINENQFKGVNRAVPAYINAQSQFANIAFYNFNNSSLDIDQSVTKLDQDRYPTCDIDRFPAPFNHPDLVIFHDVFSCVKFNGVARQLYRKKIPFIIIPHGSFTVHALNVKRLKKKVAINTIFSTIICKSRAIQYLSEIEKEHSDFANHSIVLSNGTFIPEENKKKFIPNKGISFIFIGRKDLYHKGIDLLIEACSIALPKIIENKAMVKIYGPDKNGSSGRINEMILKNKLDGAVWNLEGVLNEEKTAILKSSDVFVLTSRFEGQPLSVLEAWAYSLPVLVTPGTGMARETKENDCGWVADPDPKSIADRMCHIMESKKEIMDFSKNAFEYVKRTYPWDQVSRKAIETYEKLVGIL
jgi:glycosyltransferase involved in cell wall biosynthesis